MTNIAENRSDFNKRNKPKPPAHRKSHIARIRAIARTIHPDGCPVCGMLSELKAYFGDDQNGAGWKLALAWATDAPTNYDWTPEHRDRLLNGDPDEEDAFARKTLREKWDDITPPDDLISAQELIVRLRKFRASMAKDLEWHTLIPPDFKRPSPRCQLNIQTALSRIGVTVYKNEHDLRYYVEGLDDFHELDDEAMRALWLRVDELGLKVPKEFFVEVVLEGARQDKRHPLREWLDSLEWDGVPRLNDLLSNYAGADRTTLNEQFGRKFMIAAVRRVRKPGSKFDSALILEGPQYAGKSSFVRLLASDEYFSESLKLGLDAKDIIEQTSGVWIAESSELRGITDKTVEAVKSSLSRQYDRAALKYEKFAVSVPRQFVVIGTTNEALYLKDPTGNRRFWTVKIGEMDLKALEADRDQLWAEAAYYESLGESTELDKDRQREAAEEQSKRRTHDPFFETLKSELEEFEYGTITMETAYCIVGLPFDQRCKRKDSDAQRIGRALRELGFQPQQIRDLNGKRVRVYRKEGPNGQAPDLTWVERDDGGFVREVLPIGTANVVPIPRAVGA